MSKVANVHSKLKSPSDVHRNLVVGLLGVREIAQ
jgi:hypothetical protein